MAVFTDTEQLTKVLGDFFERLKEDPEIGPKVLASGLVIQFNYSNPDAVLTIDCPNSTVIRGATDITPDVNMSMAADTAHRFWLGRVNLMIALTKREIIAKGPIPKIMKLLPIIKNSYDMYKAYLKEIGMEAAVEV